MMRDQQTYCSNWSGTAWISDVKSVSLMMYDVHNKVSPPYLRDLFSKSTAANNYKSKLRNIEDQLDIQSVPKTEFLKKSFSFKGAKFWNSIPPFIKASSSKSVFKLELSNWLSNRT